MNSNILYYLTSPYLNMYTCHSFLSSDLFKLFLSYSQHFCLLMISGGCIDYVWQRPHERALGTLHEKNSKLCIYFSWLKLFKLLLAFYLQCWCCRICTFCFRGEMKYIEIYPLSQCVSCSVFSMDGNRLFTRIFQASAQCPKSYCEHTVCDD